MDGISKGLDHNYILVLIDTRPYILYIYIYIYIEQSNAVVGLRRNGDVTRKNAVIGLYHSSHLTIQNAVSIDDGVYTGSSSSRSRTCSMEHIPISRNTHTHKVDEPPKKNILQPNVLEESLHCGSIQSIISWCNGSIQK